jgi:hypothetical protein
VTDMAIATLMVSLTENAASEGGGVNPWAIGGLALGILLAALLTVLAIGGGRDHT